MIPKQEKEVLSQKNKHKRLFSISLIAAVILLILNSFSGICGFGIRLRWQNDYIRDIKVYEVTALENYLIKWQNSGDWLMNGARDESVKRFRRGLYNFQAIDWNGKNLGTIECYIEAGDIICTSWFPGWTPYLRHESKKATH